MDEGKVSRTALMTTFFRAHHYAHASPRIVADSLAGALLTAKERETIEGALLKGIAQRHPERVQPGADRAALIEHAMCDLPAIPIVLARARYAEDKLAEAMQNGVGQYVIIGWVSTPLPCGGLSCTSSFGYSRSITRQHRHSSAAVCRKRVLRCRRISVSVQPTSRKSASKGFCLGCLTTGRSRRSSPGWASPCT
jgi:hypothetical protein